MNIEFKIDENDYLIHQLFVASKSKRIIKKRKRNKVIVPLIYFALGLILMFIIDLPIGILFFLFALFWFLIYPKWEKKRFINHYKEHIKEIYKDRLGKSATLLLGNEFIIAKDSGSESKILTSEILEINEIPSMILIRLKSGHSFILPKDKIPNIDYVKTRLKELSTYLKIRYDMDEKWEWN